MRCPIRKFVWDLSAPLVLRRKLKRRTHPIPGGKKTIQVSPVLSVNSISCSFQCINDKVPFCNTRSFVSIKTWMFVSKRYVLPLNEVVVSAGNCFPINTNLVGNLGHSMCRVQCVTIPSNEANEANSVSTCQPFLNKSGRQIRLPTDSKCSNGQWQI